MNRLFSAALLLCGISAAAQTVTLRKVELVMDKVIVTYDLDDNNPNNEYLLNLYASRDNFAAPLKNVSGDVGPDIKPGAGKRIEWLIMQEYGPYKGKLSLEVRGKVFVPVARLQNFDVKKTYKRDSNHDLSWKPGNSNPINIELFKGGQRISGDMNVPNNGGHPFYFPKNAKPGKDYRLKITEQKNPDEVAYSPYFKVGPKIPPYLKVAPVLVAGVWAAIILKGGGGSSDDDTAGDIPTLSLP